MRKVCYRVAMSLDGYIAAAKGGTSWIVTDPEIDFNEIFSQFDTLLIGRRTFEYMLRAGRSSIPGKKIFVFSRTLKPQDFPDVTIVAHEAEETVRTLRAESGKDIWLFGGGGLFASLLGAGLVDSVAVAIAPVLLGGGTPFLPAAELTRLKLTGHRLYKNSGIVFLEYAVQ